MAHRDFDSKEKNNLFNNIYLSLKQDILWLRLKPGTLLTETYLADKFEISKTPIREALMRLSFFVLSPCLLQQSTDFIANV